MVKKILIFVSRHIFRKCNKYYRSQERKLIKNSKLKLFIYFNLVISTANWTKIEEIYHSLLLYKL